MVTGFPAASVPSNTSALFREERTRPRTNCPDARIDAVELTIALPRTYEIVRRRSVGVAPSVLPGRLNGDALSGGLRCREHTIPPRRTSGQEVPKERPRAPRAR